MEISPPLTTDAEDVNPETLDTAQVNNGWL